MRNMQIPFAGFYQSAWDAELDSAFESVAEWLRVELEREHGCSPDIGEVTDVLHGQVSYNHRALAQGYAEQFAAWLVQSLGLSAEHARFESMDSPRFYNFATDRVYLSVSDELARRMFRRTRREELERVIRERHTSRSGFHSFYSNDLGTWPGFVTAWDHNQLMSLLLAYMATVDEDADALEERILDNMRGNGAFDNALEFDIDEAKAALLEPA